jgi:glyoxylase-like metal-dependent hydrolase (beta-lactamase superfamily II)/8-oxo-dGTP pyrophosphatase MutT (NUDIX family)
VTISFSRELLRALRQRSQKHAAQQFTSRTFFVSNIAEAAGVLLSRGPGSHEIYVVRRSESLRAFGGFHAFPGGKVAPGDAALLSGERDSARIAAAARELFEEIGVLLARGADGRFPSSGPDLDELRRDLAADRLTFAEVLGRLGVKLHANDFTRAADFVTPPFASSRFDTTFYSAQLPLDQHPEVWQGELEAGRWTTAAALLDEWNRGECHVAPPALTILQAIRGRPVDEVAVRLAPFVAARDEEAIPPIFYAPLVQLIPLRTLGLPPSTHTNAFLVGGDPAYLIDPGPADASEQQRLFDVLDVQIALGRRLVAMVLSHQHPDHVGAAAAVSARYSVPIWAHPRTAELLGNQLGVQRIIQDGDQLDLGIAADGSPWHLEAIHTPGHASGHLSFYEPRYRLLFVCDMVSTLSSVVIPPGDGDLALYLDSLQRLRQYDARLLLPSHGSPTVKAGEVLQEAIFHRHEREQELLGALSDMPRRIPELAVELYRGLPAPLMRFAEMQIAAGLQKLHREGRAQSVGDEWTASFSS